MKLSDILTVTRKTAYVPMGKKEKYWQADFLGHTENDDNDKNAAAEKAISAVKKNIEYSGERVVRWANNGSIFILTYSFCWQYEIIHPNKTYGCSCLLGDITKREATEIMERHIKQINE